MPFVTSPSAAARAAEGSRPRLSWSGKFVELELERSYQQDALEPLRRFLRFSVALASLTFLAYGVHDAFLVPEVRNRAWAVRFGVFLPASALVFWLLNSRHLLRFAELMMLAYGLSASFVVPYIGVTAQSSGYILYTSYALVFVPLGPFVIRLSVPAQLTYTALTLLMYAVLDHYWARSPVEIRLSFAATL